MLSIRCPLVFVLMLVVLPTSLRSQAVQGRILSDSTSAPIQNAEVTLLDENGQRIALAISDSDGRFQIDVDSGTYTFRVQRLGYLPIVTTSLDVLWGEDVYNVVIRVPVASVQNTEDPYILAPLIVSESRVPRHLELFHRHRETGLGEFLVREDFAAWHPQQVTDIIRRIPGFRVQGNAIDVHSRPHTRPVCPPLVFFNGMFVGNSSLWNVNDVSVDELGAVEAYTRAVQVPPEYQVDYVVDSGVEYHVNCGVVALWSRPLDTPEMESAFELGLRYGSNVAGSGFGTGRLGIHLVTPFVGPIDFYAAAYFKSKFLFGEESRENSGWVAQLAARLSVAEERFPLYMGTGLILKKPCALYSTFERRADIDPGNTVFAGLAFDAGPSRPFIEMHVLDLWAFSGFNSHVITGVGVEF